MVGEKTILKRHAYLTYKTVKTQADESSSSFFWWDGWGLYIRLYRAYAAQTLYNTRSLSIKFGME
jgi:hypothetical protein